MEYISANEAARKWNISHRRVSALCTENRIPDAKMVGNMWIIPADAEKPADARTRRKGPKENAVSPKPFLKWAGGKGQLLDDIRNLYPQGLGTSLKKYAEPFVGGGAVLIDVLSRFRPEVVYISDTNRELINTYTVIRDHVEQLIAMLQALQAEFLPLDAAARKEYYYRKRYEFNAAELGRSGDIRKAALLIFLNRTCFNGLYRVNRKREFNVPMGAYKNPGICDEKNLRAVAPLLKNVTIACGDYSQAEPFIDENTFVYIDPPYRPLTQTANFTSYTADDFDDEAQRKLARYVDRLTEEKHASIMVSNSDPKNSDPDDEFFDELYRRHNIRRVRATRQINRNADDRGKISELLITNY